MRRRAIHRERAGRSGLRETLADLPYHALLWGAVAAILFEDTRVCVRRRAERGARLARHLAAEVVELVDIVRGTDGGAP